MNLEPIVLSLGSAVIALTGQWLLGMIRHRGRMTTEAYKTDAEVGRDIREYLTSVVSGLRVEIAQCRKQEAEQRLKTARMEEKADALEAEVRALRDALTAAAQAGLTLDEQIVRADHKLRGLQNLRGNLAKVAP